MQPAGLTLAVADKRGRPIGHLGAQVLAAAMRGTWRCCGRRESTTNGIGVPRTLVFSASRASSSSPPSPTPLPRLTLRSSASPSRPAPGRRACRRAPNRETPAATWWFLSSVLKSRAVTLVSCYLADRGGPAAVSHMRVAGRAGAAGRRSGFWGACPASRTPGRACSTTPPSCVTRSGSCSPPRRSASSSPSRRSSKQRTCGTRTVLARLPLSRRSLEAPSLGVGVGGAVAPVRVAWMLAGP
jgi:hypothetical protein